MAKRYVIACLVLGAVGCLGLGKVSGPPSVNKVIREMELVREEIKDLYTVVERSQKNREGREVKTEIELSYLKPDRLKSEIKGDRGRTAIINGKELIVYSPDIEVVEKFVLKDEDEQLRALYEMSWGLTSPIKVLVRKMNRKVSEMEDGTLLVELVPDQKDSPIKKIEAIVDPETWLISRMAIFPAEQSPILLTVKEWKTNQGFPEGYFDFKVPEGADVFEPIQGWVGQGF